MVSGRGLALKGLQWFIRGVQFCCAGLVFSIYSYYLATLHNHGLEIAGWIRAVEGVSGVATLYTIIQLVLLWFIAGYPVTSFIAMVLDVGFIGCFIFIAQANRGGAGSCTGFVDTPFGSGEADKVVVDDGHGGFTSLPSLHQACQLESACLAVSIVAIFFFIFSIFVEWRLARHRTKQRRIGTGVDANYVEAAESADGKPRRGFLSFLSRRGTRKNYDNILPEHTHPDQLSIRRTTFGSDALPETHEPTPAVPSHAPAMTTVAPAAPSPGRYGRYGSYDNNPYDQPSSPYGHGNTGYSNGAGTPPVTAGHGGYSQPTAVSAEHVQFPSGNYRYEDGVYDRR